MNPRSTRSLHHLLPWQIEPFAQREFAQPLAAVFSEIESEAIAAASIAQVHRARLRESGDHVAIKVQYPSAATFMKVSGGKSGR